MKNEVYLIRGLDCPVKQELIDSLSRGSTVLNANADIARGLNYFTDFLSGEDDVIMLKDIRPIHIPTINYHVKLFSTSIKYSPIFIITTQVINLNFKGVTQYITLERA